MIKVKVKKDIISISGHANYDDYGKDIVCAAVSSVAMCSVEAIATFDENAVNVKKENDTLDIIINKEDEVTLKLINNMLNCLKEIAKQYPKNIQINDREE
jgi:uncharacterized protein YsxB (DUF464 family)